MKRRLILSLAACLLAAPFSLAAPTGTVKLFLLIGQSNMAGRGRIEPQDQEVNPKILMLAKDLSWVPAKDPIHFDKPVAGVGPGLSFAREILKTAPDQGIGLIPCAVGGSRLDQWKPGQPFYNDTIARARAAMKTGTLAGILWHQGESDSTPPLITTYPDRFASMISQLRKDLGAEKVPVVIGELGRFRSEHQAFNEGLPAVVKKVPLCALVTSEDLLDKGDKLHFDSDSARKLGERYAAAFQKLAKP